MIDRDPATFRQLKRVVLMGGSVDRGYGDLGYSTPHGPDAEWNIAQEVPGAQKLFTSGVQLDMMPLDATQLKLDEVKRSLLFKQGTPLTDQLILLYTQWGGLTPTLYDPMAVAFAIDPSLCPTTPLHIVVDAKGFTRRQPGAPNVNVCLRSSPDTFFDFFMPRLMKP
jgi:inosine-uridine nucleoside N-ribohydrolase